MKCQNCGHNNHPDDIRCARCGQPLNETIEQMDIDALYAPATSPVSDESKTALYISSEEQPSENNSVLPEASQTMVKSAAPIAAAQTIVKVPEKETIAAPIAAAQTIVKVPEKDMHANPEAAQPVVKAPEPEIPLAPTVVEPVQIEKAKKTVCQTIVTCQYCNFYPILSSAIVCPQCNKPLVLDSASMNKPEDMPEKQKEEPEALENLYPQKEDVQGKEPQGTICRPFYLKDSEELGKTKKDTVPPSFKLTTLPEEYEQISPVTQQFDNGSAILNRDNTEPGNMSITSKEQAEVKYEDGNWYIENRSKAKSTYLIVERKVELQSGDIIILGNRRFKFEV